MGDISSDAKIHMLRAAPWTDAIIKLLRPRSPYLPWHGAAGAEPADAVLALLDTDPPLVIAEVRVVDADGSADRAIAGCVDSERWCAGPAALLELATLMALTGRSYSAGSVDVTIGNTARFLEMMSGHSWTNGGLSYLQGHSTWQPRAYCWRPAAAAMAANANSTWQASTRSTTFTP